MRVARGARPGGFDVFGCQFTEVATPKNWVTWSGRLSAPATMAISAQAPAPSQIVKRASLRLVRASQAVVAAIAASKVAKAAIAGRRNCAVMSPSTRWRHTVKGMTDAVHPHPSGRRNTVLNLVKRVSQIFARPRAGADPDLISLDSRRRGKDRRRTMARSASGGWPAVRAPRRSRPASFPSPARDSFPPCASTDRAASRWPGW